MKAKKVDLEESIKSKIEDAVNTKVKTPLLKGTLEWKNKSCRIKLESFEGK